jgi:hypothetical protein
LSIRKATLAIRSLGKLLLFLCALFLADAAAAKAEVTSSSTSRRDRLTLGFYFTATLHRAAFPINASESGVDLIVVDLDSGARKRVSSKGAKLVSPFLTLDDRRLLVVRFRNDTGEYELLSCDVKNFACRRLLVSKDSIGSPTEIGDNKIVYVSSPYRSGGSNVRSRHVRNDFWILEPGKQPRQLTDLQFFELNSLSLTRSSIYFSAMGPRRDKPIIPKFAPLASNDSDIFKLPFDAVRGAIEVPAGTLAPLFLSGGRSTWASVAHDESMAAFLRTQNRVGGYRYDLVVTDLNTQASKLLESTGLGFSRPIVIDRTVIVREIFDDRYVIERLSPHESSTKALAEIPDASISSFESIEIKVETEGAIGHDVR